MNTSELSSENLGAPAGFNKKNYCGRQGCESGPFQQKKIFQPQGFSLNAFREDREKKGCRMGFRCVSCSTQVLVLSIRALRTPSDRFGKQKL